MSELRHQPKPPGGERDFKASFAFWFLSGLGLLAIDQISKYLIFRRPQHQASGFKFLALRQFQNYNFAFSLPLPKILIYAIYLAGLTAIGVYLWRGRHQLRLWQAAAWALIFIGGLANVAERLVLGYVRDFIYVFYGGILNLADLYILLGIALLLFAPAAAAAAEREQT